MTSTLPCEVGTRAVSVMSVTTRPMFPAVADVVVVVAVVDAQSVAIVAVDPACSNSCLRFAIDPGVSVEAVESTVEAEGVAAAAEKWWQYAESAAENSHSSV